MCDCNCGSQIQQVAANHEAQVAAVNALSREMDRIGKQVAERFTQRFDGKTLKIRIDDNSVRDIARLEIRAAALAQAEKAKARGKR